MEEWPNFLSDIKNYTPVSGDYFIISEISADDYCDHILTPALISPEDLEKLKASELGYMVDGSGPHPSHRAGAYEPTFGIHSSKDIHLEPLILQWESNNKTILWPDQGFLMTYGLFPRFTEQNQKLLWDEPAEPENEVIIMNPISNYNLGNANLAQVKIKKGYIQDYSSLRKKIIIQLFYEKRRMEINDEIKKMIGSEKVFEIKFNTHNIRIANDSRDNDLVLVEVHGYRVIASPGDSPITEGRWDYGELKWPGFDKPVTNDFAMSLTPMDLVYVTDEVLGKFEGQDDYDITPETGGVRYSSQWAVSYGHRVGRNIIALELKKLYEGNGPEIVNHWHKFAVDPTSIEKKRKNIVDFAKELVDGYLILGDFLASIISAILNQKIEAQDVIKLDRPIIEYSGWCSIKEIERITWHIPTNLNKDMFLDRCKRLNILIVEGLNERLLRQSLIRIGVDGDKIKEIGSIKLLELLLELCLISTKSGLTLLNDGKEIVKRLDPDNVNAVLAKLFGLYYLRQQSAHYLGKDNQKEFVKSLNSFEIESSMVAGNYVDAIEIVYDGITKTLKNVNKIFSKTLSENK